MRRVYLVLVLMLSMPMMSWGQSSQHLVAQRPDSILIDTIQHQGKLQQMKSRVQQRIDDKLNEPYDTTRNKGY